MQCISLSINFFMACVFVTVDNIAKKKNLPTKSQALYAMVIPEEKNYTSHMFSITPILENSNNIYAKEDKFPLYNMAGLCKRQFD